jgi:HlyD family secretion protein
MALLAPLVPAQQKIALEAKGYVVPVRQVAVSPKVGGQIVAINVTEGMKVKAGDVIAKLEDIELKLELRHAQAKLERAKATWQKFKAANNRDDVRIAEADIAMAETAVDKARWRLDAAAISAPVAGTVLAKRVEVGSFVHPLGHQVSAIICELADLTDLEVDVAVAERDIHKLSKGQKCKIRSEAFPERVYEGELSRIMPVADRAKGAISVRVRIAMLVDDAILRPEMGAIVSFFAVK